MVGRVVIAALSLVLALLGAADAGAATLEPIGSFAAPTYVTSDPGNGNRLFVVERGGLVEQVENGAVTTFADLRAQVGCAGSCGGERGLLSIALAPDFDSSGRFFVDYASELDGSIHVAEMRAVGSSAPISSLRSLLTIPHPASNHYGGQLQFGPEGDLFVSTGDGGGENDQFHNAQSLTSLLGKILRVDPDPGPVLPYTVPAGNPFPVATPPYDTIWSYGLRNPFRFSFDSGGGGIWIGDVGQGAREEVDHAPAPGLGGGADYGWNCFEGTIPGPSPSEPGCAEPHTFTAPVFDYPHSGAPSGGAEGCAVIGGYLVRDPGLGELDGRYLYGDLCGDSLRSFAPADPYGSDRALGLSVPNLNSFGEDACGRLYAVSGDGVVSRLVGSLPTPCPKLAPLPLKPSHAGIRALSRRVRRGGRAVVTVWVSPCVGRRGEKVKLFRGRRSLGAHPLSRACTARFLPRIHRRSDFRARIEADATFEAAISRQLAIKPRAKRH